MTDDWPRDPSALATTLADHLDAVLTRPMTQGGKQYPKHVPAADVNVGERKRPVPTDPDEDTPLCAEYGGDDQYGSAVRKPAGTQRNRTRWCGQCAAILVDLHPRKHFAAPVEPGALADGGDPIRTKSNPSEGLCPLCGADYDGHLPIHIREECEEAGEL